MIPYQGSYFVACCFMEMNLNKKEDQKDALPPPANRGQIEVRESSERGPHRGIVFVFLYS